jgi:misacylated tRNA(Ala) deacylase
MERLYLKDSYLRVFQAQVQEVVGEWVELTRTAFYPGGGGLEYDTGTLLRADGGKVKVEEVKEEGGKVLHRVGSPLTTGEEVRGELDWERRYKMMRLHTGSHVLAALAYSKYGALVTGGHISPEYAKDDFNLEDKGVLQDLVREADEVLRRSIEVKVYFLKREEALKIPGIVKLAGRNPPEAEVWRIVEIPGYDVQADGGPHVRNTAEVGELVIMKVENRGKGRKRIYYTVKP